MLSNHVRNPRVLFRAAMISLLLFFSTTFYHPAATRLGDRLDGLRGFFLGVSIALMILWMRKTRAHRA
jgi:hypothetical protein